MIIAQVTDLHIGFKVPNTERSNRVRFQTVLEDIKAMIRQPDLLLLTGDLAEHGDVESYQVLSECIEDLPFPVLFAMGNHDNRTAFQAVFPDTDWSDGFLQYTIEKWPLRIIVLDTLEPGRHGGAFCEARAKWLDAELSKQPDRPTLIALHHPPINTGIDWMSASSDADWVLRLQKVIQKHDQVRRVISGHTHRTIFTDFAGTTLSVSPAVALQVKLDLAETDSEVPDDRPMIVQSQAGYSLHEWDGTKLTTHTEQFPLADAVVKFDESHAHIVRLTQDLDIS